VDYNSTTIPFELVQPRLGWLLLKIAITISDLIRAPPETIKNKKENGRDEGHANFIRPKNKPTLVIRSPTMARCP